MSIKKITIYLSIFMLGFASSFFARTSKNNIEPPVQNGTESKIDEIPECAFGHCPTYYQLDTDNDVQYESVVIVPTAMTKGAGKVVVIDKGKVVLTTDTYAGVMIDIESKPGELIIDYLKEFNQLGNNARDQIKYKFEGGKYILDN